MKQRGMSNTPPNLLRCPGPGNDDWSSDSVSGSKWRKSTNRSASPPRSSSSASTSSSPSTGRTRSWVRKGRTSRFSTFPTQKRRTFSRFGHVHCATCVVSGKFATFVSAALANCIALCAIPFTNSPLQLVRLAKSEATSLSRLKSAKKCIAMCTGKPPVPVSHRVTTTAHARLLADLVFALLSNKCWLSEQTFRRCGLALIKCFTKYFTYFWNGGFGLKYFLNTFFAMSGLLNSSNFVPACIFLESLTWGNFINTSAGIFLRQNDNVLMMHST